MWLYGNIVPPGLGSIVSSSIQAIESPLHNWDHVMWSCIYDHVSMLLSCSYVKPKAGVYS